MPSPIWSISLQLTSLRYWQSSLHGTPPLDFIAAMQRRRLSTLARINLQLAHEINPTSAALRAVFASRHGEIRQTVGMLEALAREELISPAVFSHTVHNAAQGLWSIQNQQQSEGSAIGAGLDTFAMGLLEAAGMLADAPNPAVLLMVSDEIIPPQLSPDPAETREPFALACIVASGPANLKLSALPSESEPVPETDNPTLRFAHWWSSEEPRLLTPGERCIWEWTRV